MLKGYRPKPNGHPTRRAADPLRGARGRLTPTLGGAHTLVAWFDRNQLIAYSAIQTIIQPMRGLSCWGVNWEPHLNLSMNFGQPHLDIREPYISKSLSRKVRQISAHRRVTVHGEWWLWIFCAYWKLSLRDTEPVTGSASNRRIQRALSLLEGQKLESVDVNVTTAATRFTFDLGGVLDVRRFGPKKKSDMWTLYTPTDHTVSVRGDGMFTHQPIKSKDQWESLRDRA